jgi:hypothetical protein
MKPIRNVKKSLEPGPALLWQEDIRELAGLMMQRSGGTARIVSEKYEFESIEELFERSGPRIRSLSLDWASVQMNFSTRFFSNCTFATLDPDQLLYQELEDFFSRRRTLSAYFTPIRLIAFSPAVFAWAYLIWFNINRSVFGVVMVTVLFLLVFWLYGTFWGAPQNCVRLRNYSKRAAAFEKQSRIRRYAEWAAAAILGSILTIAAQLLSKSLGW